MIWLKVIYGCWLNGNNDFLHHVPNPIEVAELIAVVASLAEHAKEE